MTTQTHNEGHVAGVDRHLAPLAQDGALAGVVYGLVTANDEALARIAGGTSPLDEDTSFEIGSVTKVFTAILLADMVVQGEVRLEDPIGAWMPEAALPHHGRAREITLLDLATHHSGLARIPRKSHVERPDPLGQPLRQLLSRRSVPRVGPHRQAGAAGSALPLVQLRFWPARFASSPAVTALGGSARHALLAARSGKERRSSSTRSPRCTPRASAPGQRSTTSASCAGDGGWPYRLALPAGSGPPAVDRGPTGSGCAP
jgi:hypothetical protein